VLRDRDSRFSGPFRRGLPHRRRPGHPHSDPGTEGERVRRTMGENGSPGVPRPHLDPRPTPPGADPPGVRGALQRGTAAPGTAACVPFAAPFIQVSKHPRHGPKEGPTERTDSRVPQVCSVTRICVPLSLDHVLIFGRRHLQRVLGVYAEHYNRARLHRSMDLRPPDPAPSAEGVAGSRVRRRDVLGGLIHEYQRSAA
jgi:hypothetical protein